MGESEDKRKPAPNIRFDSEPPALPPGREFVGDLSRDQAREAAANVVAFFNVLAQWAARQDPEGCPESRGGSPLPMDLPEEDAGLSHNTNLACATMEREEDDEEEEEE
jgi:hypothetical protein